MKSIKIKNLKQGENFTLKPISNSIKDKYNMQHRYNYFEDNELQKIVKIVPDFNKRVHFNIADIQAYDENILQKLEDKEQYNQIADINLFTGTHIYGGRNVRIYKSTKANGHYIFWEYCWGD